ncbi:hypothetical protein [Stenotrophomonas sp.]|uniref:hypothetical protein n=1 Tax=Stenotrophomonas sp. TaxID=69392 RepID=UPI00289BED6D|nr:hypothetical protein [Stenotrophomonas sp.]
MPSGKFFMRPGDYMGTKYGLEARQLDTGEIVLEAVIVGHRNAIALEENSSLSFSDIEEAFAHGSLLARRLIEGGR